MDQTQQMWFWELVTTKQYAAIKDLTLKKKKNKKLTLEKSGKHKLYLI